MSSGATSRSPTSWPVADKEIDISVVIVNWNTRQYLKECLESIPEAVGSLSYEVVVVDNASEDGSVSMLRTEYPWVKTIVNAENLGFGCACNRGLARSTGRYIALVNPDVILSPESLQALVAFLQASPAVGLVGPQSLAPNGQIHPYTLRSPSMQQAFLSLPGAVHLVRAFGNGSSDILDVSSPAAVDRIHGSCMVAPRRVLEAIGGVPERTFMYGEEVIMGHLVRQAGYKVCYYPLVAVMHYDGSSANQRWAEPDKKAQIRIGLTRAAQEVLPPRSYRAWNLVMLLGSSLRFALSPMRSVAFRPLHRAYMSIHWHALTGRDFQDSELDGAGL